MSYDSIKSWRDKHNPLPMLAKIDKIGMGSTIFGVTWMVGFAIASGCTTHALAIGLLITAGLGTVPLVGGVITIAKATHLFDKTSDIIWERKKEKLTDNL